MAGNGQKTSKTTIAVTGGSGFVGGHLLQQLLQSGYRVRALKHRADIPQHENLEVVSGSLSDPASLSKLVENADCVIHCGGAVAARSADGFFKANERGTANLIKATEQGGVQRFLYLSSMAAREPALSPYAASKRAGEDNLKTSSIPSWDIVRPPAIYGPGDEQLLPLMRLLKNRIGILAGGRDARVSVVYVSDLTEAITCWITSGASHSHIYEIDDGHENGYSWPDLMGIAADVMKIHPYYITPPRGLLITLGWIIKTLSVVIGKTPFVTPDKLRELSHSDWVRREKGLESAVNWAPQTDFRKGIEQTLDWYKQNGLLT